ncbi:MAG: hypothetical protein ACI4P9_09050 [Selenomonadaceae bacterium]
MALYPDGQEAWCEIRRTPTGSSLKMNPSARIFSPKAPGGSSMLPPLKFSKADVPRRLI